MQQTAITKRERKTLVQYYLKEIEKRLQNDTVEHLQYFNGQLTVHNPKLLEKFLELDFEYSQSTGRIYLRDAPYSYIDIDDIDLPDVVKCIAIGRRKMVSLDRRIKTPSSTNGIASD